jgi:hypothetical protein
MILPLLLWSITSGTAEAACSGAVLIYPNPSVATMQELVDEAEDGDTIRIVPGDPTYYNNVFQTQNHWQPVDTIHIGADQPKHLCIEAATPPSEIDDQDLDEDVFVEPNLVQIVGTIYAEYEGVFRVYGGSTLEIRNLHFKGVEWVCDDGLDNDGNGLVDADDPICEVAFVDSAGAVFVPPLPPMSRVVTADPESTVIIEDCVMQGFAAAFEGGVLRAEEANVTLLGNVFSHNRAPPFFVTDNFWWTEGEGGVLHLRDSKLVAVGNTFLFNEARRGGAIWAQSPNQQMELRENHFINNFAEDGGAVWGENIDAHIQNNFFINNRANLIPLSLVPLRMPQEGGAIWVEDSRIRVNNNVFHLNASVDYGGAIYAHRDLGAPGPNLEFYHNTFVGNTSGDSNGGVLMFQGATFTFWNNILANSFGGGLSALDYPALVAPYVQFNDFHSSQPNFAGDLSVFPVPSTSNLSAPPMLSNTSGEAIDNWWTQRYWALPGSPTINAGDPLTAPDPWLDIAPDLGAYGGAAALATDNDGDNWPSIHDCDDTDPGIYPSAPEPCDNIDNDCDGVIDELEARWFEDKDYDGYGDPNATSVDLCPTEPLPSIPGGGIYVRNNDDCNDFNPRVNPGTPEYCDSLDNDCDGAIDEDILPRLQYPDADRDGYGDLAGELRAVTLACPPEGFSPFGIDCNDGNPEVHPLVRLEHLGHTPLASATVETSEASRSLSYVADGVDQDCDGFDLCYSDADGDKFGAQQLPGQPAQYTVDTDLICSNLSARTATSATDCDDNDPLAFPGGVEVTADGRDQNCDGRDQCWEDNDGDGYGSDQVIVDNDLDCDNGGARTSSRGGDCDDRNPEGIEANQEKEEICDGLDNNCDGQVDEVSSPDAVTYYLDADGDGFGLLTSTVKACGLPLNYAEIAGDCDDASSRTYPGNTELCDGIDNNCVDGIDEASALDVTTWYVDRDLDGYGDAQDSIDSCYQPEDGANWVRSGARADCDDNEPTIGPCAEACGGCSAPSGLGRSSGLVWLVLFGALARRRDRRAA